MRHVRRHAVRHENFRRNPARPTELAHEVEHRCDRAVIKLSDVPCAPIEECVTDIDRLAPLEHEGKCPVAMQVVIAGEHVERVADSRTGAHQRTDEPEIAYGPHAPCEQSEVRAARAFARLVERMCEGCTGDPGRGIAQVARFQSCAGEGCCGSTPSCRSSDGRPANAPTRWVQAHALLMRETGLFGLLIGAFPWSTSTEQGGWSVPTMRIARRPCAASCNDTN